MSNCLNNGDLFRTCYDNNLRQQFTFAKINAGLFYEHSDIQHTEMESTLKYYENNIMDSRYWITFYNIQQSCMV